MSLRKIHQRKLGHTRHAHPGQAKSASRKRARRAANRLETEYKAATLCMTPARLRQTDQKEVDTYHEKGVVGAIRELWGSLPSGRPWERYYDW